MKMGAVAIAESEVFFRDLRVLWWQFRFRRAVLQIWEVSAFSIENPLNHAI